MVVDFTIHQLQLFVAVAEELHFHRAAERMHISQPPLTRHIRALESTLGVQLLERSSRAVHLTRAGVEFLAEARRVISSAEAAAATARRVAAGQQRTLIIGCVESATMDLLPLVLSSFCQRYPEVPVHVRTMHTRKQEDCLATQEIDIGILRPPTVMTNLSTRLLYTDKLIAAVAADSELKDGIGLDELADQRFLAYDRTLGVGLYSAVMQSCIAAGFVPQIVQEASNTAMILGLVAAGRGVCLLPQPYTLIRPFGVRFLELSGPTIGCGMAVAWRTSEKNPLMVELRQMFVEASGNLHHGGTAS